MRKIRMFSAVFLMLLPLLAFSQNHRFVYDYSFKQNSLNRNEVEKEVMILDVFKEGSTFYSQPKHMHDSIISGLLKKEYGPGEHPNFASVQIKSKIHFSFDKQYPKYESLYKTLVGNDVVGVTGKDVMKWEIASESKIIEGMKAQKATTNFGGRKWIAWFTNEINIPEGPFKFYGLPGLILHIEDDKKDHVFTFIGSKKLNYTPKKIGEVYGEEILLNRDKFKKFWAEYKKDPAGRVKMQFAGGNFRAFDSNGEEISSKTMIKDTEEYAKQNIKKNNNFIELSLYQ